MLRLGIVDFDSSHSAEFTRRLNHFGIDPDQWVDGARVVLGCPGTSAMSPERIPGFTREIESCGVEIVADPREMLGRIDAVLVLSLCGSAHLAHVRPFLEAGIPAYVDKPFACGVDDAREMLRLAETHGQLLFNSSSLRFSEQVLAFQARSSLAGQLHGAITYGPAKRAELNPGLLHYGIHAIELLYTLLGPGCVEVSNCAETGAEVVTGRWRDGRIGTVRGVREGSTAYGFLAFCERGVISELVSSQFAYRNLCREIVRAFQTGKPAVPGEVSLEIVQFAAAALASEQRGGQPVSLAANLSS